ncbi:hypothetical protein RN001_006263 [Aquatica leii]|uniref:THAP-type domain-containing protein n=1 Tax=Aquatica leii TaxID=1421715 RepID=A0AAN7SJQ8_9COLE|nr:hypothetical protein RN001_006263 [Aquatica leii]
MSGLRYRKYCCVKNCKNNSKNNPSIRFFRIPADAIRCQNWLKNSGRADLTKKDGNYCHKQVRMYSSHFENRMVSSLLKNRLKRNAAVPTLFEAIPVEDSVPQQDCLSESMQQTNQSVDTSRFTIESETGSSIIEVQPSCSYYSSDLATTPVKSSKDVFSQTSSASTANTR